MRGHALILIAGTIDLDPARRADALREAEPHLVSTRAQSGCLDYQWSADPLRPGRIYVYERWEDEASLAAHFKGDHYWAMRRTMEGHDISAVDVSKYRIDLAEPVYDDEGVARADFFTG